MMPEDLDNLRSGNECRVCRCVPVNNQGHCAKHAEPGDTVGATLVLSPTAYQQYKAPELELTRKTAPTEYQKEAE